MYVHKAVASAVRNLYDEMEESEILHDLFILIGFDGTIVDHFLLHCATQEGYWTHDDHLANTVQASSRTGEIDTQKFYSLLRDAQQESRSVTMIDFQTHTGKLGEMLRESATRGGFSKPRYVVLFDPNGKADMAGRHTLFLEKDELVWTSAEDYSQRIRKVDGEWRYDFTHEAIAQFKHVAEVKKHL